MNRIYSKQVFNPKTNKVEFQLNETGEQEFNRWLKEEQNPFYLLSANRYKKLYKSAMLNFSREELEQAGTIALWQALLKFDSDKNNQLSTYLTNKVLGQVSKLFLYNNKVSGKTLKNEITWEKLSPKKVYKTEIKICPIETNIEQETLNNLRKALDELPGEEKELIEDRFFKNKTWEEIARGKDVVPYTFSQRGKKILEKLKFKLIRGE